MAVPRRGGRALPREAVVTLRALTVRNPYAWAVALGHKTVENRPRRTSYRGLVAIHAGAAWHRQSSLDQNVLALWTYYFQSTDVDAAYLGPRHWRAVVAVADLYDCHVRTPGCCRNAWADPRAAVHWLLRDIQSLPVPVPTKGALGLWVLPPAVEAAVTAQTARSASCSATPLCCPDWPILHAHARNCPQRGGA